jgi:hypothetical protein
VLDHAEGYPLETEEKAADPLAGGIANQGYQCGMLWGMTMAAGAKAYRTYGPGAEAETAALITAQQLVPTFRGCNKNKDINCEGIIGFGIQEKMSPGKTIKFILTGKLNGVVGCLTTMAGKSAKAAYRKINENIRLENHFTVNEAPVSCTARFAQMAGANDIHQVMAAGLAGGIGLCGGGCGVLGTAIWLNEINQLKNGADRKTFNDRAKKIVDKFLKAADYEIECEKIAGRIFQSGADHAAYLRDGGCGKILETMAGALK